MTDPSLSIVLHPDNQGGGRIEWEGNLDTITLATLLIWWTRRAAASMGSDLTGCLLRSAAEGLAEGRLPGEVEEISGEVQGNA